jgi:hypothetical protein
VSADLDRTRALVKELADALGVDKPEGKRLLARTEQTELPNGQTLVIDIDQYGEEIRRTVLPRASTGIYRTDTVEEEEERDDREL